MWWYTTIIPVLGRLWQEDREFKANLNDTVRLYLKKKKTKTKISPNLADPVHLPQMDSQRRRF
jgi:hypothetical protein